VAFYPRALMSEMGNTERKGEPPPKKVMTNGDRHSSRRSLLRWAGSKRKLLPLLIELSPTQFSRYIEPFVGSACLFLALQPKKAVLGDINTELIETYIAVKRHPRRVYRAIRKHPVTGAYYYRLRKMDFSKRSPIERAARFLYLNRFCFNGVFRTNRRGQFNVPRGKKTGKLPDELSFLHFSATLRNSILRASDFEECLKDVRKGDFVYLDPPYASSRRRNRGEYGYNSFGTTDLARLIDRLKTLDKLGVRFLLSFAYSSRLLTINKNWNSLTLQVRRHVAGFGRHRRNVREILIFNYSDPRQHR
jgi:DNA adenine methylase